MDPEIPLILSKIVNVGSTVVEQGKTDAMAPEARKKRRELLILSQRLTNYLQNEGQIVENYLYGTIDVLLLKIGADLGLFRKLSESSISVTLDELVAFTGADEVLLARIMRGLTSINAVDETGTESYFANKVTHAFAGTKGTSGLQLFTNLVHAGWMTMPKYLRDTHYKNPVDDMDMPFNKQFNGEPYFEWLAKQPALLHPFHQFMTTQREGHPQWLDFYPIEEELLPGFDTDNPEAVLLVDVGGSVGHEIQAVKRRFPNLPGRMILQDLPASIARVVPTNGMEAMAHDFFKPQPVKGARAYYFRSVLHDWDDEQCLTILKHIKEAMIPGYSKILINEFNIPLQGACNFATHSDFMVMAVNAAVERTEKQWYNLIERAGLRIDKIWTLEPDAESLIEVTISQ